MFAPIRPRPIIPSCTSQSSSERCITAPFSRLRPGGGGVRGDLENSDKLAVAAGDLADGGLARRLPGPPVRQGIPKDGPADRKSDEAGDAGRRRQPLSNLGVVLTTPENDAADGCAPPARAAATIFSQSSRRSRPSIFHTS